MKLYWVNTKYACGGVAVDQFGKICFNETAPIYRWAAKKQLTFQSFKNILCRKGDLLNIKLIGEK